jgi:hypothetical protein
MNAHLHSHIITRLFCRNRYTDSLQVGLFGFRIPVKASDVMFSTPVHTCPGAYPACCKMGRESTVHLHLSPRLRLCRTVPLLYLISDTDGCPVVCAKCGNTTRLASANIWTRSAKLQCHLPAAARRSSQQLLPVKLIAECPRTDCNGLEDKKKLYLIALVTYYRENFTHFTAELLCWCPVMWTAQEHPEDTASLFLIQYFTYVLVFLTS